MSSTLQSHDGPACNIALQQTLCSAVKQVLHMRAWHGRPPWCKTAGAARGRDVRVQAANGSPTLAARHAAAWQNTDHEAQMQGCPMTWTLKNEMMREGAGALHSAGTACRLASAIGPCGRLGIKTGPFCRHWRAAGEAGALQPELANALEPVQRAGPLPCHQTAAAAVPHAPVSSGPPDSCHGGERRGAGSGSGRPTADPAAATRAQHPVPCGVWLRGKQGDVLTYWHPGWHTHHAHC